MKVCHKFWNAADNVACENELRVPKIYLFERKFEFFFARSGTKNNKNKIFDCSTLCFVDKNNFACMAKEKNLS